MRMLDQIDLQEWYPPNRSWALAQGSVLLILCLWVVSAMFSSSPAEATRTEVVAPPPVESPFLDFTDEARTALHDSFPADPISAVDQVQVLTDLVNGMEAVGVSLISREVDVLPTHVTPTRQRVHLTVAGTPRGHALFMHHVLATKHPIVVSGFEWSAGKKPDARYLKLSLDILVENAR